MLDWFLSLSLQITLETTRFKSVQWKKATWNTEQILKRLKEGLKQETSCNSLYDDYGILFLVKCQFSL